MIHVSKALKMSKGGRLNFAYKLLEELNKKLSVQDLVFD
jgi:hypothetical protein